MLKWLTGRQPIPVWVIKQIDDSLLHLCGQGVIEPNVKSSAVIEQLRSGRYEGAVTMAGGGLVLNARLFAALVPLDALQLDEQGHAHWNGRSWYVAQVPQRCWTYEERLVPQRQVFNGQELLVSVEDVSTIRRQLEESSGPGQASFEAAGDKEHPLIAPRGEDLSPSDSRRDNRTDIWRGHDD
ncbi:hypothetical protein [Billgrantia kenyensis]|uniref:Uncharacterized protein n=1 Tax=Billgrantia kenyensis TaxID=321266 RepID=A0A7V9VY67_9GAMM|nr:hypothetical protein [Halomonas kenyensis]MBA2777600.1 hypothetical protein [Halomonas kenyensis]MCG6660270.1 hypothetical protein [Halomonas kenyensis]